MQANDGMFWHALTRLGESQILLPAALLAAFLLARRNGHGRTACVWLAALGGAVFVTLVSKFAFMGWGLGWAAFDFSGVSGHAMLASAVYPVLFAILLPAQTPWGRWGVAGAGMVVALLVGVSRVMVGAHSSSEVIVGLAVGGLAAAAVLERSSGVVAPGPTRLSRTSMLGAPLAISLWLIMMPAFGPHFNSHSLITQWSLQLSGRAAPYTRSEMLREWRERKAGQGEV